MKTPRFWLLLALVAVLAVAATACGGDDDDDDGAAAPETTGGGDTGGGEAVDCTASIGIMGPFTGDVAAIGQEQLNWAKFAVETFNEERGTTFELVEGDTQLDPAQASVVAPQFVDNDAIVAVVGPAGSQEIDAVNGANTWSWDGKGNDGQQMPDGAYTVAVTAAGTNLEVRSAGRVTGAEQSGQGVQLRFGTASAGYDKVVSLGRPGS